MKFSWNEASSILDSFTIHNCSSYKEINNDIYNAPIEDHQTMYNWSVEEKYIWSYYVTFEICKFSARNIALVKFIEVGRCFPPTL